MRLLCLIALATVAASLSACGSSDKPAAPPGSPQNPLVGQRSEASSEGQARRNQKPGYEALVQRQTKRPRSRFTPCNLVTRAQARAILGGPVQAPLEAPQGPTCIYRSESGKSFITLAVQTVDFDRLRKQIRRPQTVDVANRAAYCGTYGQPMLYVALTRKRVLSVAAPCSVARQFALRAVARLEG